MNKQKETTIFGQLMLQIFHVALSCFHYSDMLSFFFIFHLHFEIFNETGD